MAVVHLHESQHHGAVDERQQVVHLERQVAGQVGQVAAVGVASHQFDESGHATHRGVRQRRSGGGGGACHRGGLLAGERLVEPVDVASELLGVAVARAAMSMVAS